MDYKEFQAGQSRENFWFKAKNDLIDVLMRKACKNKRRLKILNVGAGTGDDIEILNKYGSNYVIDINKKVLSIIDDKLCYEKRISDACNLPYDNNYFDVAVCFDVLEHIKNDKKTANEIHRVLKNEGCLLFIVPAFKFIFSNHDEALDHKRRYSMKNIKSLLGKFNLKIYYWNSLLFPPIALMRILKRKSKPKVDHIDLPSWLDATFHKLLKIDNFLIKLGISMPIGLSIVGIAFKGNHKHINKHYN